MISRKTQSLRNLFEYPYNKEPTDQKYTLEKIKQELAPTLVSIITKILGDEKFYDRTKYCNKSPGMCDPRLCKEEKRGMFSKKRCVPNF